jgi:hypothetical protein
LPCSKCVDRGRRCVYPAPSANVLNVSGERELTDSYSPSALSQSHIEEPVHTRLLHPFTAASEPVTVAYNGARGLVQHVSSEQATTFHAAADIIPTNFDYELPWNDFLVSPQFLFPFSPLYSYNAEGLDHTFSGDTATRAHQQDVRRDHGLASTLSAVGRFTEIPHDPGSLSRIRLTPAHLPANAIAR